MIKYDGSTGEMIKKIPDAHSMGIIRCDFLPDGKLLTASND